MKTVKIPTDIFGEWAVTEVKLKTDLEFNATMNRIVEMAEEGLITESQMYDKLVYEILLSFGETAAHTFVVENPF